MRPPHHPLAVAMPAYAAWYQERDNSMVDANDEVGDAMAVIIGGNGTLTQTIQVCAGVYLATAHGAMDNPIKAKELNRPYGTSGNFRMTLIAYPMSVENVMRAHDESDYISQSLRDPSN